MPKITFRKRNGGTFTKSFKSKTSAKRALKGWTRAGGRVRKTVGLGSTTRRRKRY